MYLNEFKSLIKECIIEVLKEDLLFEAFDPTSQGPNPVEENPYVMWNAHMRKLEEDESTNPHGRYAQNASAGQFDPRTFGVNEKNKFLAKLGLGPNYKPKPIKKYKCPNCKKPNAVYKEVHADTDINEIELQCPDCKYSG